MIDVTVSITYNLTFIQSNLKKKFKLICKNYFLTLDETQHQKAGVQYIISSVIQSLQTNPDRK